MNDRILGPPYNAEFAASIKQADEDMMDRRIQKISLDPNHIEIEEAVARKEDGKFVTHEDAIKELSKWENKNL